MGDVQALVEAIVAAAGGQIAADAEKMCAGFRAAHDPLDTRKMLEEGRAAVEELQRDRQRRYDRNAGVRAAGQAVYEATRARYLRETGAAPSVPVPSQLADQSLAAWNLPAIRPECTVMGTIPPDPARTRPFIF